MKSLPLDKAPKRFLTLIILAFLTYLAYSLVVEYRRVVSEPISSWTSDPSADCAVVLTGGPGRVREGLSLLARNLVKKLIISGVNPDVEFQDLYNSWIFLGEIDEKDIALERRSTTTFGNAQQSLPIVEALGCRDIVLVTAQYHMPRAYKTFAGTFPIGFPIYKHTLVAGRSESGQSEIWTEVIKSVFYSFWAY